MGAKLFTEQGNRIEACCRKALTTAFFGAE